MKWGNFKILEIDKEADESLSVKAEYLPDNKDFKKTIKVNWLADHQVVRIFSTSLSSKLTILKNNNIP